MHRALCCRMELSGQHEGPVGRRARPRRSPAGGAGRGDSITPPSVRCCPIPLGRRTGDRAPLPPTIRKPRGVRHHARNPSGGPRTGPRVRGLSWTRGGLGVHRRTHGPPGGPLSAVERAFGVRLQRWTYPGGTYRGRTGPIHLSPELATIVRGVFGLDNRPQGRTHFRRRTVARAGRPLVRPTDGGGSLSLPQRDHGGGPVGWPARVRGRLFPP